MSDLLERNDLQVTDESEVLDALVSWLKYDWDNRKAYTISLLGRVRLGVLPREKIIDFFENQLAVFEDQLAECRALYMDFMKFYAVGKKSFVSTVLVEKQHLIFTPRIACESAEALVAIGYRNQCFEEDSNGLSEIAISIAGQNRSGHAVAIANGNLYCAGGYCQGLYRLQGSFVKYNKQDHKWNDLQQMNYERSDFGFIYLDGYLYAIGGTKMPQIRNQPNNLNTSIDTVERYNISTGSWQKLPCLPHVLNPSTRPSIAIFKHCLIVAGYYSSQRQYGAVHNHLVMLFNTKTNTWHTLHANNLDSEFHELHVYISYETIYLVAYQMVASKYSATSQWKFCPTVYKCQIGTECSMDVETPNPTFTIGDKISQQYVPETNMRVFRIGKEVYVILRGYVYKDCQ
ncbi:kelch-like protein 28 [Amphiura filiformis]|uniref:kelch-like protein 28 n=1 Tax=Amphiura filiformis TaxID=82378 RepID=UPI003B20E9A8